MRFEGRGEHAFFFFNPTRSTFVQSGSGGVTARRWPPPFRGLTASARLYRYQDYRFRTAARVYDRSNGGQTFEALACGDAACDIGASMD